MFTSQATQGYSEGLADNEQESEVSSIFGIEPGIPNLPQNGEPHVRYKLNCQYNYNL